MHEENLLVTIKGYRFMQTIVIMQTLKDNLRVNEKNYAKVTIFSVSQETFKGVRRQPSSMPLTVPNLMIVESLHVRCMNI
jgi:hypothetical protein